MVAFSAIPSIEDLPLAPMLILQCLARPLVLVGIRRGGESDAVEVIPPVLAVLLAHQLAEFVLAPPGRL